jgi:hypothetical protein
MGKESNIKRGEGGFLALEKMSNSRTLRKK